MLDDNTQQTEQEKRIMELLKSVNKVAGFDPSTLLIDIQDSNGNVGKYLQVKDRITWFRLLYPTGTILTEIKNVNEKYVVMYAKIIDDKGKTLSTGTGMAWIDKDDTYKSRAVECAETAAVGRALLFAGFGTSVSGNDLMENPDSPADSPIEEKNSIDKKIENIEKSMNPALAYGMIVPCGKYQGLTLKDLLKQRHPEELQWIAQKYQAKNETQYQLVAAARFLFEAYEEKKKKKNEQKPDIQKAS